MPRWSLGCLGFLHAMSFAWAAFVLPWTLGSFALASAALAVLHLVVCVLACLAHRRLAQAWRLLAFASLGYLVLVGWGLVSSAAYVHALYASLGPGIAAALVFALLPVVVITVPIALWGLAATGGVGPWRRSGQALLGLSLIVGSDAAFWWTRGTDVAVPAPARSSEELGQVLAQALRPIRVARAGKRAPGPSLHVLEPVECPAELGNDRSTAVATYVPEGAARPVARCLQGTVEDVLANVTDIAASTSGLLRLDVVKAARPISSPHALLDGLELRPAVDGVCAGKRCLLPWQLVAQDAFTTNAPLGVLPDVRFGVSWSRLKRALRGDGPLVRFSTVGVVVTADGDLHPDSVTKAVAQESLTGASRLAEGFIETAQNRGGQFAYVVRPFAGKLESGAFSASRQAGTTLAWCEHARSSKRKRVAEQSLALLAGYEKRFGDAGAIVAPKNRPQARLGPTALTLATLIRCRPLVGTRFDGLIGRLGRTLLRQQRRDGGFHHGIDASSGRAVPGPNTLFADGQAVLGLTLLETLGDDSADAFPPHAETRRAVERAMTYFGSAYWNVFARQFFFVAENWHCIAAAASLAHHRNDAYERFCLDYTSSRNRLNLDASSHVLAEYMGGHGIGSIVPPHNAVTAGHAETLAAAIAVERARGGDAARNRRELEGLLAFLLRSQWTDPKCFACSPGSRVTGGFSEHAASPDIRIDYVQHAWAAITTGASALGITTGS